MKTAIVKTDIWKDDVVYKLNIDTKLLYLFLTTSPERNTTRFYKCPDRLLSAYVGLANEALEVCKSQLQELELIFFFDDWVIIGDRSYVQPSSGKLTGVIYDKDLLAVPTNVKEFARMKKLSTEKSSGVAPEYKDIDKDKFSSENNFESGDQFSNREMAWDVNETGDAVWKR